MQLLFNFIVHLVAPSLSRPPQDATFYFDRIAFLECGVNDTTFPPPLVRWYKDSVLVDYSGRNFFSPNTKSLIIRQIRPEDNGRYTCEVSNVAGDISHSANLTVLNAVAAGKYVCNCERTKLNVVGLLKLAY